MCIKRIDGYRWTLDWRDPIGILRGTGWLTNLHGCYFSYFGVLLIRTLGLLLIVKIATCSNYWVLKIPYMVKSLKSGMIFN